MRKIRDDEIKKVSALFADIFEDYDAYKAIFPRDKKWKTRIYYCYIYEVYNGANYTYVEDDYSCVCTIKKPGDVERDTADLWKNPLFALEFISKVGVKACKNARRYIRLSGVFAEKYYNPSTDCYIKNIGVAKSARGQGKLRKMLDEICGDAPIYLETHLKDNVAIYEKLGFTLLEVGNYNGYDHYCMKRFAPEK